MNNIKFFLFLLPLFVYEQVSAQKSSDKEFNGLILKYEEALNKADTILAKKIWKISDEDVFIHPRGTEYGWGGVKNVYNMFDETFSKRKLKILERKIHKGQNVTWLTCNWVFDAIIKKSNTPIQTKGRETQIWFKSGGVWKLVHVHYSGMPIESELTSSGNGF